MENYYKKSKLDKEKKDPISQVSLIKTQLYNLEDYEIGEVLGTGIYDKLLHARFVCSSQINQKHKK